MFDISHDGEDVNIFLLKVFRNVYDKNIMFVVVRFLHSYLEVRRYRVNDEKIYILHFAFSRCQHLNNISYANSFDIKTPSKIIHLFITTLENQGTIKIFIIFIHYPSNKSFQIEDLH